MAISSGKRSFRSGSKKIFYNVIKFCYQEAENGELIFPIAQSTKRSCQIAGVFSSTIKKIIREVVDERNSIFCSPKKELRSIKDLF